MNRTLTLAILLGLLTCVVPAESKVSDTQYVQLREDAFAAAQGTIVSAAADALSNVALRFSQGTGRLADLVKQRELLQNELLARQRQLESSAGRGDGQDAVARVRAEERELSQKLDALDAQIAHDFPNYAELTRPLPLASRSVQALLNPDEALLLIVPTSDGTYLFALTRDKFDWARSDLKEDDVTKAVSQLRQGLDPSDYAPSDLVFDRKTAYQLYRELIAPLERIFADKKVLLTATSGAMQSLPLSVLVTAEPQGDDRDPAALEQTHWLIDKYALVTLPAVSSLVTLRCATGILDGSGICPRRRPGADGNPSSDFAGIGAPLLLGASDRDFRGGRDYSYYTRGELSDVESLRQLPPLAGAETELSQIADYFAAARRRLFIGANATETNVKQNADIAGARVVVFATHAFIADEKQRVGEPGLVLTPPPNQAAATEQDDGLLTASEAAQLKLSAELVVLSACNTARRDGRLGADGLAGLARAFLFAGARSLVVSHWSVSDKSTPDLMRAFFTALKSDAAAGRGMALRSAILTMKRQAIYAAPTYWAPFVVVGDTDEVP